MSTKLQVNIIAALDLNRGIGFDGQMPWHIKEELRHFKTVTTFSQPGQLNAMIMGRKTWESLPEKVRPLPDRFNIVISRQAYPLPEGVHLAHSFEEALSVLSQETKAQPIDQIFVMGGGQLYQETIYHPAITALYITQIKQVYPCDTWFPDYQDRFRLESESENFEENGVRYAYQIWQPLIAPAL